MSLTTADAQRILQAAQAKATEMGAKVSISIVDARGDLVAMLRLDGARWHTPVMAQSKAAASSYFGMTSKEVGEKIPQGALQSFMMNESGNIAPVQGAVPITRNGEVIGGIGASGASAQDDEDVARVGANAL
jgi:uncharacterized protein GlcG (DUF336 family)